MIAGEPAPADLSAGEPAPAEPSAGGRVDVCVIGGGIVGLATALAVLRRRPGLSLLLLEKEHDLGQHQTGHNSGVIHSGIYYPPGSLKAELCKRGARATQDFAARHDIPVQVCGKLLVATSPAEVVRMDALYERARINGVTVERIDRAELSRREPYVTGLAALLVPQTAIVDYVAICRAMATEIAELGGRVEVGAEVVGVRESAGGVAIRSIDRESTGHRGSTGHRESTAHRRSAAEREITAGRLAVCAGLQADRLARLAGLPVDFRIVPFRGEYYRLRPQLNDLVRHLIYPVPDPELPFLGVHVTRTVDGGITLGPNAVLGAAREGYPKFSVNWRDVADYATFPGTWQVARQHLRTGLREARNSLLKRSYLRECQRYCPGLRSADMLPAVAGIRAQAVLRDGTFVHDFLFRQTARTLHVCNAPSPAATSAIPIGEMVADQLLES